MLLVRKTKKAAALVTLASMFTIAERIKRSFVHRNKPTGVNVNIRHDH